MNNSNGSFAVNSPALSLLALCRKAAKLKMGFDAVQKTLPEAALLMFCSDISPKTRERMLFFASNQGTPYIDAPFSSDEVHLVVGKKAAVLAITDTGFAKAFCEKLSPPAP